MTENGVPVAGVNVDLLYDANGACTRLAYPSNLFQTQTTDENGLYNFTNTPSLERGNLESKREHNFALAPIPPLSSAAVCD